jgi:hypothetical protein
VSEKTEPEQEAAAADEKSTEDMGDTADEAVDEVPLNRAARRAKAKQAAPSHVGPRFGQPHDGRGPRAHTKRR